MTDKKNLLNEEALEKVPGGAGKATYTCGHCMKSFPKNQVIYIPALNYYLCLACAKEMGEKADL